MIKIVKATESDLEQVQKLRSDLINYEKKYGDSYDENWPFSVNGIENTKKMINNDYGFVLIAKKHKRVVGVLVGSIKDIPWRNKNPIAEIINLFIVKDFRKQGVAKLLIQEFFRISKKSNVRIYKVTAMSENKIAIDLYKKLGFSSHSMTLELHE